MKQILIIYWLLVALIAPKASSSVDSLIKVISGYGLSDSVLLDSAIEELWDEIGVGNESSLNIADSVIFLIEEIDYKNGVYQANLLKADLLRFANRSRESIHLIDSLIDLEPFALNEEFITSAYGIKAGGYYDLSKYSKSAELYFKAIELAEKRKDKEELSLLYYEVGLLYFALNDLDKGKSYLEKSYLLSMELGRPEDIATGMYSIGSAYQAVRDTDSALLYLEKSKKKYSELDDTIGFFNALSSIAGIVFEQGDYDKAIELNLDILEYDKKNGSTVYICSDYMLISQAYLKKKDYKKALEYANKSLGVVIETEYFSEISMAYNLLSDIYIAQDDYKTAFMYHHMFMAYEDSVGAKAAKEHMLEVVEKYQNEKNEAENMLLRSEQEKNRTVIRFQKIFGIVLIGIVLALIIVVVVFAKQHKINKRLNSKLFEANEELGMINTAKDRLFSIISHDLKGPIGTIQNMVDMMYHDSKMIDEKLVAQFIPALHAELGTTYSLLDNLLTWSKKQFKQFDLHMSKFELKHEADKVVNILSKRIAEKEIEIENTIPAELFLTADVNVVSALIRNLVSNAVKFTPAKGKVSLSARNNKEYIEVCVADTGIGIPDNMKETLFAEGVFKSTRGTNQERGTGLGLKLCKEFVEMHGGQIWVESQEGLGSKFFFDLPIKKLAS